MFPWIHVAVPRGSIYDRALQNILSSFRLRLLTLSIAKRRYKMVNFQVTRSIVLPLQSNVK